ncbi:MAG: hypothetical protein ABSA58_15485 [Acetobacteraceae bacterium]
MSAPLRLSARPERGQASIHLAKFVTIHVTVAAVAFALWRAGVFGIFPRLSSTEMILVGLLAAYAVRGFIAMLQQRWEDVRHVANSLPMYGLCFTVLGILLTMASVKGLSPESVTNLLLPLICALTPNMVGVGLMIWMRELAWWMGHEEV